MSSANYFQNFNDASGTITSGGTSQVALAASSTQQRSFILIQNNSATDSIWINFGSAASASGGSIQLLSAGAGVLIFSVPGLVPQNSINIYGATTGDSFTLKYA